MLPFLRHLEKRERIAFVRNALRFPLLAALLLYAYVPILRAGLGRFGPIITTAPGPWAGVVGAVGCLVGMLAYAGLPFLRRERLHIVLADVHFYLAALACMGLFFGLFQAGSDAMFQQDPELVARFAGFVRMRSAAGWLLCATALLPVVALVTQARARRTPSSTPGAPASP